MRDGLDGVVAEFAVGSRFKGSVRNGLNGAVEPGFAIGSRFKGSIRDGLNDRFEIREIAGSRCCAGGRAGSGFIG